MTNSGKYSVLILGSETPTQTEIANALLAALRGTTPVWTVDMVSPDNIRLQNSANKIITLNASAATALKVESGKSTKKKSTKGTVRKPGRSWKS